jgi:hypothetical protein
LVLAWASPSFAWAQTSSDSVIPLREPQDGVRFARDQRQMLSWGPAPNETSAPIQYTVRMVEIQPGQSPHQAMKLNDPFWEPIFTSPNGRTGSSVRPTEAWPHNRHFAWQVECRQEHAGEWLLVGRSEVRSFYSSFPTDFFQAGMNHRVEVLSTPSTDLSSFSGIGRLRIGREEWIEISFENLQLEPSGAEARLRQGSVDIEYPGSLQLTPAVEHTGTARLEHTHFQLTRDGLRLFGTLIWHPPDFEETRRLEHGFSYIWSPNDIVHLDPQLASPIA